MLTLPAATSLMPTVLPPWATMNFTLWCWSAEYLAVRSSSSGNAAVEPDRLMTCVAYAAAGSAIASAAAASSGTRVRRGLSIN
jgi:hypothetical protein